MIGWADPEFAYFAASDLDRKILDELQDAYSATRPNDVVYHSGDDALGLTRHTDAPAADERRLP